MAAAAVAKALARERIAVLASLLALIVLAWLYLWLEAARMATMGAGARPTGPAVMASAMTMQPWAFRSLLLTFLMWSVMMVGMMLPSAAPAIVLYGAAVRRHRQAGSVLPATSFFTAGYLFVWVGFSLAATILQTVFQVGRLLTPALISANTWLSATVLIAAGIYQLLPVKGACLEKCQTPLSFFLFRWRSGKAGAFWMGAEHGLFCVGCCWALMLVLFVTGVMNLLWVALIAGFVIVEKLVPGGNIIGRIAGVGLALAGGAMIVAAF